MGRNTLLWWFSLGTVIIFVCMCLAPTSFDPLGLFLYFCLNEHAISIFALSFIHVFFKLFMTVVVYHIL